MSMPVVLAKGCVLDSRYQTDYRSSSTHMDLQYIRSDLPSLKSLTRATGVRKHRRDGEGSSRPNSHGSGYSSASMLSATGVQIPLTTSSYSASRRDSGISTTTRVTSATPDVGNRRCVDTETRGQTSHNSGLESQTSSSKDRTGAARLAEEPDQHLRHHQQHQQQDEAGDDVEGFAEQLCSTESITGSEHVHHKSTRKKKKKRRKKCKASKARKKSMDGSHRQFVTRRVDGCRSQPEIQPLRAMCLPMKPMPPSKPRPSVTQPALTAHYQMGTIPSPYRNKALTSLPLPTQHKYGPNKSADNFGGASTVGFDHPFAQFLTSANQEIPRVTKVYLSDKQSKSMNQFGAEFPCPPPCTPLPDSSKQLEYIPSMSDVRSQRAVRARLEAMEKIQLHRQQKRKDEQLKQEKLQQQQHLREMQRRQRLEIYALNKIMTEFENQQFEQFKKQHGLKGS